MSKLIIEDCICCGRFADVIDQGMAYCQDCWEEKLGLEVEQDESDD